jgi:hypothetical protein
MGKIMNELVERNGRLTRVGDIDKLNKIIDDKMNFIQSNLDNENMSHTITNEVVKDIIVDKVKQNYRMSKINMNFEISEFLKIQNSDKTRNVYEYTLSEFIKYCNKNGIDILKIDVSKVDSYLNYLNTGYSPRSVRLKITTLSSFFKFLICRSPESFKINPFYGRKLPKIIGYYKKDYITENDFSELKKELKRIGRKDILCLLKLLNKYGWRIGIFENMKIIYENCEWESISKGDTKKGRLLKSEIKEICETGLLELRVCTMKNIIKKYTNKLYKEGKISCNFSVHDIRRKCILDEIKENNGEGFLRVSKKFHKNPNTTYGYIQSYFDR